MSKHRKTTEDYYCDICDEPLDPDEESICVHCELIQEDEYPISCDECGGPIFDNEDDYGNTCEECYNTPPSDW